MNDKKLDEQAESLTMVEPPSEALPDGETVSFVKKFKSSLAKKWSYTKSESIWSMGDLACFLWALDRRAEAFQIAHAVALAIPSPPALKGGRFNFSIWSPATRLHGLVVHLDTKGDAAEVSAAALVNEPGFARDNPDHLQQQVENARILESTTLGSESQKWECVNLSRSITCMNHFREVAAAGDSLFVPYAIDAATLIPQLLPKLGSRLMDKK